MRQETGTFTTADGLELFTQRWLPEAPQAIIILLHGYAEHSSRYRHVAEFLVARGFAVHTFDYRGHGKSEGQRAYLERFDLLVEDAVRFVDLLSAGEGLKRVLLGHSTGGAVALNCALRREFKVEALILSSPYLRNAVPVSPVTEALGRFLSRTAPMLPVIRLNVKDVSRELAVVEAYRADPLVYNKRVRARTASELAAAGRLLEPRLAELTLPLLIMCGSEDKIAALAGSELLYERAGSSDKTLKVYDGHYHELFNDLDKERVLKDMVGWLTARL
ncbi:MAG: lysophospholipase [Deinococcota bacterium]|nr:lysophospholipase [Deinococcota bacterium]